MKESKSKEAPTPATQFVTHSPKMAALEVRLEEAEKAAIDATLALREEVRSAMAPGGGVDQVVDEGKLSLDFVRRVVRDLAFVLQVPLLRRWASAPQDGEEFQAHRSLAAEERSKFDLGSGWYSRVLYTLEKAAELAPPEQTDSDASMAWTWSLAELRVEVNNFEKILRPAARSTVERAFRRIRSR